MLLLVCASLSLLLLLAVPSAVVASKESLCSGAPDYRNPAKSRDANVAKWAIVALIKPGKEEVHVRNQQIVDQLGRYVKSNPNRIVDIIFFSEHVIPTTMQEKMRTTFVGFHDVLFVDTSIHGFNVNAPDSVTKEKFGYKYMCKFFSIDIYQHLRDYDYYMRCDSDCYINDMGHDVFDWTERNQVEYGFAMRKLEAHGPTKQTMPEWVKEYTQTCAVIPSSLMDEPLSTCFNFYNNWHIGKVDFFLRPDVYQFLSAVEKSNYILTHRWGDSTVQAYAVRLFMNPKHLKQIPKFKYVHGSHSKTVSTFGDGSETDVPQRLPNWNN